MTATFRNLRSSNHSLYKRHTLQLKQLKNWFECHCLPVSLSLPINHLLFSFLLFSSIFIRLGLLSSMLYYSNVKYDWHIDHFYWEAKLMRMMYKAKTPPKLINLFFLRGLLKGIYLGKKEPLLVSFQHAFSNSEHFGAKCSSHIKSAFFLVFLILTMIYSLGHLKNRCLHKCK